MPIIVVKNGNIMYLNRLGLDVFKTHYIEDVMGTSIKEYVHEDSYDDFCKVIDSYNIEEKRIRPFLAKMKTVHGDLYWAEIIGSKVRFNKQQSLQLILRDVSLEKLNEKKVIAQEQALLDMNRAYFLLDSDFVIGKVNKCANDLVGKNDVVGENFKNFILPDDCDLLLKIRDRLEDKEKVHVSFVGGKSCFFNMYDVCSISGGLKEIVLIENV